MYLNDEQKEVAKLKFRGWLDRSFDDVVAQGKVKVMDAGLYEEAKKAKVEEISDYIFDAE